MKILGLGYQPSGCAWHRITIPLGFMNDVKGIVTDEPTPELLAEGWDIVFYNRFCTLEKDWAKVKEMLNCKVVMDIDDDWDLPPDHIMYDAFQQLIPILINNMKCADLVTCTNERLANKVRLINPNVLVLPNALPYGNHQYQLDKVEDERIRLFWSGSISHEKDLEILKFPIRKLNMHKDKIKMVIGGYNDSDENSKLLWDRMVNSYTFNKSLPYMKLSYLMPNNYMQLYEYGDIGLVPLEKSDWHGCKSNLKILELASKKIPAIVSKVEPYSIDTDAPVLWVENQKDWFKHINFFINNPEQIKIYGEKIYQWAVEKYNIKDVNEIRRKAFADLIKA